MSDIRSTSVMVIVKRLLAIEKSKPYGDNLLVTKIECVGHIQKRMGARLRKRKIEMKGKKLGDGKVISGKGRLTDDVINKLTIYYGNAIRKHSPTVLEQCSEPFGLSFIIKDQPMLNRHISFAQKAWIRGALIKKL